MGLLERLGSLGEITEIKTGKTASAPALFQSIKDRTQEFASMGLKSEDRVMLHHGNTIAFFIDLFAIWKLNACAIPVDQTNPPGEVAALAQHCGARFAITSERTNLAKLENTEPQKGPGNLILYTSGSTGNPKGVVHDLRTLENRLAALEDFLLAQDFERSLCLLPTHFGHGLIGNSLYPLLKGCHLFIAPAFDPVGIFTLASLIDKHQITFFSSVPSVWRILENQTGPQANSLRRVHCGSAPFENDLPQKIRDWVGAAKIINMYGMTEVGSWTSGHEIKSSEDAGCVGFGWNAKIKIDAPNAEGVGNVWVESDALAISYLHLPELTSERMPNGWFNTGDLGFWHGERGLKLKGRIDDLINKGGMKIHPEEIEAVLKKNPAVANVCAFGISHEITGETVAVAYVPAPGHVADAPALEHWCRNQLPAYRVPTLWFDFAQMPVNSRGKVSRNLIRKLCQSRRENS